MKKVLASLLAVSLLAGCGNNEAQEDYERCNEEWADGMECTEEEFREFLMAEAENNAQIFGGMDEATDETMLTILDEIDEKVDAIFYQD